VIKHFVEWCKGFLDLGKVQHPAKVFINSSRNMYLARKGMAMEPITLVIGCQIRQPMRCLEGKLFKNVHSNARRLAGSDRRLRVPIGAGLTSFSWARTEVLEVARDAIALAATSLPVR